MVLTNTTKFLTPAQASEILGISVATLRKYSLIVEHSTNNPGYFERNKQNNRLYTQKNLDDFNKMVELGHGPKMTLQSAAAQIYPISDDSEPETPEASNGTHNAQVANLENTIKELRANIDQQDRVIENLSKKLLKFQEGDSEGSENQAEKQMSERDRKYQEYLQQVREAKEKKERADAENAANGSGYSNVAGQDAKLKTLVNMQVTNEKKDHWWNRFIK
jgi:DNA-binding transcriptional MerR regulator